MHLPFYGVVSMSKSARSPLARRSDVPGPGTYDIADGSHADMHKNSLITFKKRFDNGSCFDLRLKKNPGPGAYEIASLAKRIKPHKSDFKLEKYKHICEKMYPSSELNLPGSINSKNGFSFGYREETKLIERSPGAIYDVKNDTIASVTNDGKQFCRNFGYGPRLADCKGSNVLGPGSYSLEGNRDGSGDNYSIGRSKRSYEQELKPSLGPGEYNPKILVCSKNFTIKGKIPDPKRDNYNTYPGSYDIPDTKSRIGTKFSPPKQTIGTTNAQESTILSPFSYKLARVFDTPTSAGFSIGRRIVDHKQRQNSNPGPGNYELRADPVKNFGGYMGRKIPNEKQISAQDNFYKYNPNIKATARESPRFSFGSAKRNQKENVPQYYKNDNINESQPPSSKSALGYTLGHAKRFPDAKKEPACSHQTQKMNSTIGCLPSYFQKK